MREGRAANLWLPADKDTLLQPELKPECYRTYVQKENREAGFEFFLKDSLRFNMEVPAA